MAEPTILADPHDHPADAEALAELAQSAGHTLAVAESLTGGAISSQLGAAPSSSDWFRGGVVAYSSEVKHTLLKVPEGPVVSEQAARAMAAATSELLGSDVTLAVTGVGGPDRQDGQPVGTTWYAVCVGDDVQAECRQFDGEPDDIVKAAVEHALRLLHAALTASKERS